MKIVNSMHILIIFPFKHSYEKGIYVGKGHFVLGLNFRMVPKVWCFFLKMLWFRSWSNKKDVIHIYICGYVIHSIIMCYLLLWSHLCMMCKSISSFNEGSYRYPTPRYMFPHPTHKHEFWTNILVWHHLLDIRTWVNHSDQPIKKQ
jgi:hypothetical protein